LRRRRAIEPNSFLTRILPWRRRRPAPVFLGDKVFAATHRGKIIYLPPTDLDLTPRILRDGVWEPHVERVIRKNLRRGDIAIDAGANVGYHTLAMAEAVGKEGHIHAFEANPDLTALLAATMYANGFSDWHGAGRVTIHHGAVMDRSGVVTMASAPGHFASGFVMSDSVGPGGDYSQRINVRAVTLDDALADRVAKVDLIRMDIEGSEPLALQGARALIARSPEVRIVMEWFVDMMRARADVEATVGWLVGQGFRFWVIRPNGRLKAIEPASAPSLPPCDLFLSRRRG